MHLHGWLKLLLIVQCQVIFTSRPSSSHLPPLSHVMWARHNMFFSSTLLCQPLYTHSLLSFLSSRLPSKNICVNTFLQSSSLSCFTSQSFLMSWTNLRIKILDMEEAARSCLYAARSTRTKRCDSERVHGRSSHCVFYTI